MIDTANHFTFGDQSLLNSQAGLLLLRVTGFGSLNARRGLALSEEYVRTFFDVTLNGAPPSRLKELSARYTEVTGVVDVDGQRSQTVE
jgi:hypothetical protein